MNLSKLKLAIQEKKKASIVYKGVLRIVEPYLIGINKKGNEALRAYQVGGISTSGNLPAWRMFLIDDIEYVDIIDEHFEINSQYNPNDRDMDNIICRVG